MADTCKDCETNCCYLPGLTVMTVFATAVATIVFLNSSNVVRTSAANTTAYNQLLNDMLLTGSRENYRQHLSQ